MTEHGRESHASLFDRCHASPGVVLLTLALVMGGCVPDLPGGGAREPSIEVPGSYGVVSSGAEADPAAPADGADARAQPVVLVDWHAFFSDPNMVSLIDQALANNQELNIAVQEILITNNEVMARRGDILPEVQAGVMAGADHVGATTSQGRSDDTTGLRSTLPYYAIGVYASWEVDIWRRLRNLRDAAINRYLASIEGRNFMVTRVVAEIATSYYELMAYDEQLEVVHNSIELMQRSVEIVQLQFQAARATQVAVARFEAELRRYQAQEFTIRQHIVEAENRLNFLVGRFPQHIDRPSVTFLDLQPPDVRAGLPGELLENRPDIRQAELELEATRFDVRAARARYFPSLRLDAGVGYEASRFRSLFNTPSSILFRILGQVMGPLFNRRAITAAYFTADANQQRAVLAYERSILSGYMEVVNRMNLIANSTQSLELRVQQVERLNQSIELSTQLFNAARGDYLEVLTARRDALEAQLQLIENKQQQLSASVGLYQSLGGGWR